MYGDGGTDDLRDYWNARMQAGQDAPSAALAPLRIIDPRRWTGPAPERSWIVPQWIPRRVVTGLYGDGAAGKTLLAQQAANAVALGIPWLGLDVQRGRAITFLCEDDEDELWRRQEAINAHQGTTMADLDGLRLVDRFGLDNDLIRFDGARAELTPFHAQVMEACEDFRPDLVVLDTAADLFAGNEVDRGQVRRFVQQACGVIARTFDCGVLLNAHPSAAGIANKTGAGGSTAWNNTVRSRLYLTRPEENDPDARRLSRMKANYAAQGEEIALRWHRGVLVPDTSAGDDGPLTWTTIGAIFDALDAAWREGNPWSSSPQAKRYGRWAPAMMEGRFGVPEKLAKSRLAEWMMNDLLKEEMFDAKRKARGLKVLRRLTPDT